MEDNSNSQGGCQPVSPQTATQSAMGVIYKITNTIDGKIYIGKTKRTLGRRITEHKRDSSRGRPGIDAAIAKYGWENFKAEVVETCPVEQLNEHEIFWIAELNSKTPNGYNITDGGDGGRGHSPTKETRDRISAKLRGRPAHNKGVKHTDEARARMSAKQKAIGSKPPNHKGKKRSPETIARMSASQKATWARKKAVENGGNK